MRDAVRSGRSGAESEQYFRNIDLNFESLDCAGNENCRDALPT